MPVRLTTLHPKDDLETDLYPKTSWNNIENKPETFPVESTSFRKLALNAIYPIGSIYITTSTVTSPSIFLGGVWERLSPGRMLLDYNQNYPILSTGGEESVTLNENQMPSHTHLANFDTESRVLGYGEGLADPQRSCYPSGGMVAGGRTGSYVIQPTGGNQSHNNMPPYIAVCMWKRVS